MCVGSMASMRVGSLRSGMIFIEGSSIELYVGECTGDGLIEGGKIIV